MIMLVTCNHQVHLPRSKPFKYRSLRIDVYLLTEYGQLTAMITSRGNDFLLQDL